jgi:hypothetical protein
MQCASYLTIASAALHYCCCCVYHSHRALRFYHDGTVSYVLLTDGGPADAAKVLYAPQSATKTLVTRGTYTLQRREVVATLVMPYATVVFRMLLGSSAGRGHCTQLDPVEHYSIAARDPRGTVCPHKVNQSESFVFSSRHCHW